MLHINNDTDNDEWNSWKATYYYNQLGTRKLQQLQYKKNNKPKKEKPAKCETLSFMRDLVGALYPNRNSVSLCPTTTVREGGESPSMFRLWVARHPSTNWGINRSGDQWFWWVVGNTPGTVQWKGCAALFSTRSRDWWWFDLNHPQTWPIVGQRTPNSMCYSHTM